MSCGVLLVLLSALTASSVQQLLSFEAAAQLFTLGRPSSSLALVNVVMYFLAVLLLLAEAQYVRNRTLWQLDRVEIAPGIAGRWGRAALLLVAAGVAAALLAPTEGLLGLAEIVRFAAQVLILLASIVTVAIYLIFWILTYPLRWLFGGGEEDTGPTVPVLPPPITPPTPSDGSLFEVIKSLVFWAVAVTVFGYALVALWQQGRLHRLFPGLAPLGAWVVRAIELTGAWLMWLLRGAARGVAEVGRLIARARLDGQLGPRRGTLAGLLPGRDPRWVVIAIYGLLVTRAGERGLDRRVGQTALEYRRRLREGVPSVAQDVDDLTDAFVRARYGPRAVSHEDASLARRCWARIRAQLHRAVPSAPTGRGR
jgi:hypothetical protein